ncbi:MAG TPA: hypothetical protein VM532_07245 [Burkholderiales bacterium]|nr:hypothetical protein [Burkholderiales bacterium]
MTASNSNITHLQTPCRQVITRSSHANKRAPHGCELRDNPDIQAILKISATQEAENRWPGITILTERQLDNELGVAVYFTFPGGKHMAVWMSGADELGIVAEDRPGWRAFVSAQHMERHVRLFATFN